MTRGGFGDLSRAAIWLCQVRRCRHQPCSSTTVTGASAGPQLWTQSVTPSPSVSSERSDMGTSACFTAPLYPRVAIITRDQPNRQCSRLICARLTDGSQTACPPRRVRWLARAAPAAQLGENFGMTIDPSAPTPPPILDAADALAELVAGNKRFV